MTAHGRRPAIGDRVIVPVDPERSNGATCAPAIVTRVWNDTCVNLRVFADTDNELAARRTSCTLVDEIPLTEPGETPGAVWGWPPRA